MISVETRTNTPRHEIISSQLSVEFRRFVGAQTRISSFVNTPDVTLPDMMINPDWEDYMVKRKLQKTVVNTRSRSNPDNIVTKVALAPIRTPGRIILDEQSGQWKAVDERSHIGQIEKLQTEARKALENGGEESHKRVEAGIRTELVGIFNDYANKRFNGARDVVNKLDFTGTNIRFMASRPLIAWRSDLMRTSEQAQSPVLFDRWEKASIGRLTTPSRADEFIYNLFRELRDSGVKKFDAEAHPTETQDISRAANCLKELLSIPGPEGYISIANTFYGGDMEKTYNNLSALAKKSDLKLPKHIKSFKGMTAEFRILKIKLKTRSMHNDFKDGIEGYLETADNYFGGRMQHTHMQVSAVVNMCGLTMPEGWHAFVGSTDEFRTLKNKLSEFTKGIEGYLAAADELYSGNMDKTYINLAAVAKMTGLELPEGWQAFHGSTTEFTSLENKLKNRNINNDLKDGIEGYLAAADELYDGNMSITYKNVSTVANMTGLNFPDGWHQFQGTTIEFRTLKTKLNELVDGIDYYLAVADDIYHGDMKKTFGNLSSIARMSGIVLPKDWREFRGSTTEFKSLQARLKERKEDDLIDGIVGYIRIANELYGGDMAKTYINVAAVAKMSKISLPIGWQQYQGTTAEFVAQRDWLRTNPTADLSLFQSKWGIKTSNKAVVNFNAVRKMGLNQTS